MFQTKQNEFNGIMDKFNEFYNNINIIIIEIINKMKNTFTLNLKTI